MCVDTKCTPRADVAKTAPKCEDNCNDRGICNNVGNCHCENGFGGGSCEVGLFFVKWMSVHKMDSLASVVSKRSTFSQRFLRRITTKQALLAVLQHPEDVLKQTGAVAQQTEVPEADTATGKTCHH